MFLAFILNDVDETFSLNFYKKKGAFGDGEPRQARAKGKTYNCHSERSEESFGKRSFVPQDDRKLLEANDGVTAVLIADNP